MRPAGLRIAKAEHDERSTLWPEEGPIEGNRSVISGHMRELMTYARRIAKTKVNVLITGGISRQQNLQNQRFPQATGVPPSLRHDSAPAPLCGRCD